MEENRQGVLLTCCMPTGEDSYIFNIMDIHLRPGQYIVYTQVNEDLFQLKA